MHKKELIKAKCEPCSGNTHKLGFKDISSFLSQLDEWSVNDNQEMIFKKFKFSNFRKALAFTNKVGELAEKEQHHPDVSIGYGYCLVMIHTHAIKGLSINDFILASKIDTIDEV